MCVFFAGSVVYRFSPQNFNDISVGTDFVMGLPLLLAVSY